MYTDFKSLPDSLEADELEVYFRQFLSFYARKPKNLEALNELYELAYRQWDTYENLDPEIERQLEDYLMAAINFKSYDVTDIIISIVENLTMKRVFDYIVRSKQYVTSSAIRKLIIEAEEEYADSIDNPYGDMDDD
ncbi:MAG: hypothetical protein IJ861_05210 [Clostridia bacterium]|nr:hypothetical protein [Clostridia bacterium]